MSSSGHVHFYTCREADAAALIRGTFALGDSDQTKLTVWRTIGEEDGWKRFCAQIGRPTNPKWTIGMGGRAPRHIKERTEAVVESGDVATVVSLYRPGSCLDVSVHATDANWKRLDAAIRTIPESIRGGFVPSAIGCRVGWHDIFDYYEDSFGAFIARAFYSLQLFGWGLPNDWPEFRRQFYALPEIVELKRNAEAFAGPLEACMIFDG